MDAVECLNIAFQADPNAVHALVANRVPCNRFLADDRFVVVGQCRVLPDENWQVGALGLVNAVLAASDLPLVASEWSEPDADGHRKLIGFCEYRPEDAGDQPEA